jgi:hypothetical protein
MWHVFLEMDFYFGTPCSFDYVFILLVISIVIISIAYLILYLSHFYFIFTFTFISCFVVLNIISSILHSSKFFIFTSMLVFCIFLKHFCTMYYNL